MLVLPALRALYAPIFLRLMTQNGALRECASPRVSQLRSYFDEKSRINCFATSTRRQSTLGFCIINNFCPIHPVFLKGIPAWFLCRPKVLMVSTVIRSSALYPVPYNFAFEFLTRFLTLKLFNTKVLNFAITLGNSSHWKQLVLNKPNCKRTNWTVNFFSFFARTLLIYSDSVSRCVHSDAS